VAAFLTNFSPEFLDEIRSRIRVSEIVGKRLKLVKRGREFLGICPFHNDTKPSLAVVDDKNFYHCFACGAHGDIIKFTMEIEGLTFPETIEKLADIANLEVPIQSPEMRVRENRRKTLKDVNEEACKFYEQTLQSTKGKEGLDYLRDRGLSDPVIKKYRLGFSLRDNNDLLETMDRRGFALELLIEAGLVRVSEQNKKPYDYFRNRVMFPISDRRGQVIGFGARTIGDSQPKYLNSPETPLFHKGRILYGSAQARESSSKYGEIIVTEGYMDVIALANSGITNVVAPLGTALTEDQINELWRLGKEPFICFDGDQAGMKAAVRAADRALPILRPGYSLQFSMLALGEDPDDLIKRSGVQAFKDVLTQSIGLADFIWRQELRAGQNNTPERQADFFKRIRNKIKEISDRGVYEAYKDNIEQKIRELRDYSRSYTKQKNRYTGHSKFGASKWDNSSLSGFNSSKINTSNAMAMRQKQSILATFINHPELIEEFGEALGYLDFGDPFLDKLRLDILDIISTMVGVDVNDLQDHLLGRGYDNSFGGVINSSVLGHAAFARHDAPATFAKSGVRELLGRIGKYQLEEQLSAAQRVVMEDFSEVNWNRLASLRAALVAVNNGTILEDGF